MATLSKRKNGNWEIQFFDEGRRKSFYPGKLTAKQARTVLTHVEHLAAARKSGTAPQDSTSQWLASNTEYRERLHRLGLCAKPEVATVTPTLADCVEAYIKSRADVKETTIVVWRRCQKLLLAWFDATRSIDTFTLGDAKDFRQFLIRRGLSDNTVRKMCSVASQIFNDAVDREWLLRNPFQNKAIPRTTKAVNDRQHYITEEVSQTVLQSLPTLEWQLIFALSRWGGLRCPSEVMSLEWSHILWDRRRIIVPSPKTEHHTGHEQRIIPLFPELEPLLSEAWDMAPDRTRNVVRYHTNPGVTLKKLILQAGIQPWPKIFHNMRSTRQTELAEAYGIKAACSWLGNSITVADANYLQVHDALFEAACSSTHKSTAKCTAETS